MLTAAPQVAPDRPTPEKAQAIPARQPVERTGRIKSPPASDDLSEEQAAMLELQRTAGNQAVLHALTCGAPGPAGWSCAGNRALRHVVQFKRQVALPNDPHELEADRVAEQVTAGATPCSCAGGTPCKKCEEDKLSRRAASPAMRTSEVPHAVNSAVDGMRGHGTPLSPQLRAHFEPRFGQSFRDVRVHTGGREAESARAVDALAYTVGRDIVFAPGRFDPHSNDGRRLLAHELAHVVQQGGDAGPLLYRQNDPAPPPDPAKELAEREQKAFEAAGSWVGKSAIKVWFTSPKSPLRSPETEQFSVEEVVKRPPGPENRIAFDASGPALAYAIVIARGQGAVVVVQDKLYFAARLAKGNRALTGGELEPVESSWTQWALTPGFAIAKKVAGLFRERNYIYRVEAATGAVVGAAGKDGFIFPLGADLEPDPDRSRFQKDPAMPTTPDAESMRAIAGIAPESPKPGEPPPPMPDVVEIPAAQQRLFITSYFRARGQEALASNEQTAAKLTETFKPTTGGTVDHPSSGVSAGAKALIDSSRKLGVVFKQILDREAKLAAVAWFVEQHRIEAFEKARDLPKQNWDVTIAGETKTIPQWQEQIKDQQKKILDRKNRLLSLSPLLAQLVERSDPESRLIYPDRPDGSAPRNLPIVTGANPYDESLLAKGATPENDEAIRVAFLQKLDAIREAIRRARSEMVGSDSGFLLGMGGLRERIKADLSRTSGKNPGLRVQLDEMLKEHAAKELAWTIGQIVIQVGLLFLPGGAFLSGAFGFAVAAEQMGEHLRSWDVSKAAIDPASALVDQQEAETSLAWDTFFLAVSALDLASGVNEGLTALERGGKAVKVPGAIPKEGEGGAREFKFQDKFRGEPHELRIRPDGVFELCSDGCGIFERRVQDRIKNLAGGEPWGDFKDTADALISRARANDIAGVKAQQELDSLKALGAQASEVQKARVQALEEELEKLGESQKQVERELEAVEQQASRSPNRDPITGEPKELLQPTDPLEFDPKTLEFTDPVTGITKHGFGSAEDARKAFELSEGVSLTLDPSGFKSIKDPPHGWEGISRGHCGVYKGGRYVGTVYENVYQGHTFYTFSRGAH